MSAIVTEKEKGVAFITLNRPERLNALDPEMATALHASFIDVATDLEVRCVVVCGEGDGFMAGGDLRFFEQSLNRLATGDHQPLSEIFNAVHGTIRTIHGLPKPIIASVHGAVAGFGVSLVAACDLAIAAKDTVFTMAYCHIGTSPDGGSTFTLPRMIGLKRSMELALLGDRFDADHAVSLGLINRVVPGDDLRAQTEQLAVRLAAGPTKAYAKTKMLLNTSLDADLDQQLDREQAAFLECATSDDFAEGVTAFLDKRRPRFRGR
jgi:2-(1,2-epoxy-1,2-dihydrophenyl)acetyl-CoA isomerase